MKKHTFLLLVGSSFMFVALSQQLHIIISVQSYLLCLPVEHYKKRMCVCVLCMDNYNLIDTSYCCTSDS